MGRASELRERTKRDIKNAITTSLRQGSNVTKACADAGIERLSFYRWMEADVHFAQAVKWAKKSRISVVEDALYKSAVEGDVAAQKFFLTNRDPDEWKERGSLVNNGIIQGENGRLAMPVQINVIGVKPDAGKNVGHGNTAEGGGVPLVEG